MSASERSSASKSKKSKFSFYAPQSISDEDDEEAQDDLLDVDLDEAFMPKQLKFKQDQIKD